MTVWVIDASVAAKWLAPEAESAQASGLLGDELHVPDLLFAEVANILWKKHQRGEMHADTAAAGARWLLQLPLQVHGCAGLTEPALALALRLQHPAYDCLYLALAERLGAVLVTADKRLFARCQQADAPDLAASLCLVADLPAPAGQ